MLLVESTPGLIDLASNPVTSEDEVKALLSTGVLIDVTSVLAPGGPVHMVAPVIDGR